MPHEETLATAGTTPPFPGQPITIKGTTMGDFTMNVPEPHSMVTVGRRGSGSRHEQQLKLFTLVGLDRSNLDTTAPHLEIGIVTGIEIRVGTAPSQPFPVTNGDCEIKIFFTHK